MNIYFIRHGESKLNAERKHQDSEIELSDLGIKQANLIAERTARIQIDKIFSSPMKRARQTAEIIGSKCKLPIEFNDLLVEIKRPTEIELKSVDDPKVIEIKNKILDNWDNQNYRHSDEETFFEFKKRGNQVLQLIKQLNNQNVLFITHGNLIRMIICLMVLGDELNPRTFNKFLKYLALSNTGITVCKYEKEQWKLITWNDTNHFPV